MIEPGMSPVALRFYRYLHLKPVNTRIDPFAPMPSKPQLDPFDANQEFPTLLFNAANRQRLNGLVPELAFVVSIGSASLPSPSAAA
jgi:hypothetical protein